SSRSASSGSIPSSSTTLSREPCPATRRTSVRASVSVSASSVTTASLARPRSGASATRIFHASPWRPTIPGRLAPGATRSLRRVVVATTPHSLPVLRRFDPSRDVLADVGLVHDVERGTQLRANAVRVGEQPLAVGGGTALHGARLGVGLGE